MPRQKKINKYVPETKLPNLKYHWRVLEASGKYDDIEFIRDIIINNYADDAWYINYVNSAYNAAKTDGQLAQWKTYFGGVWRMQSLYRRIFPFTEEFAAINESFFKEYDARDDLKEIYKIAYADNWNLYDLKGNRHFTDSDTAAKLGWKERPESFMMFVGMLDRSIQAKTQIELSRPTPYQAGDLVLLRDTAIDSEADPMRVDRWSSEFVAGARTPDKSIPRIGTLLKVCDSLDSYKSGKGSKRLKVQWVGKDTISDVAEKYVKWHERPTLKNGLKIKDE